MGEAKRRAGDTQIVAFGAHAENPEVVAATCRALAVLHPIITELARRDGDWQAVLNALTTLLINLEIELRGVAKTELVLRQLIRQLLEFAQARLLTGHTAGSA